MSSRVFVVQRPAFYDREKRGWVNKYDLTPALKYGDLIFLLRPGNVFRDRLDETVKALTKELADFGMDDHILAVGDPVAIAAAVMVASQVAGGRVSILKFDRLENRYDPYVVDLYRANKG